MVADKHKGVQYNIRLDAGLLKKLQKRAKQNHVSATAEIAARLGKSFWEEEMWGPARHAIFAWGSTFVWAGNEAAKTNNIEINQWTTDRRCLDQAWVAATRASLDAIASTPDDRRQLIEHFLTLETSVKSAKWEKPQ
jgi:Arc-like DNA binding domain